MWYCVFSNPQWMLSSVLSQLPFLIPHRPLVPTTFVVISFIGGCPFSEFHLFSTDLSMYWLIDLSYDSMIWTYLYLMPSLSLPMQRADPFYTLSTCLVILETSFIFHWTYLFSRWKTHRLSSCSLYRNFIPFLFYIFSEVRGLELHIMFKL